MTAYPRATRMPEDVINEIVLASTNRGKIGELREMLQGRGVTVRGLDEFAQLSESQETGSTFAENARQKALYYGEVLNCWVLADDSGLEIDALQKAPGVYSARFADFAGDDPAERDRANNDKVLSLLSGVAQPQRTARFCCCLCLCHATTVMFETCGAVEGFITTEPRGHNGFGYDPLFFIPRKGKTAAQLSNEEKNVVSHRGRALAKLLEKIEPLLPQ